MKKILFLLLFFILSNQCFAKENNQSTTVQSPVLWKLETQPPSWLFGTIHIPDPRVNQLPCVAKVIFDKSDIVLTEIPMESANIQFIQLNMQRHDGKKLSDVLPENVQARLDKYLKSINVMGGSTLFQPLKTWAVFATLSLLEVQMKHPLTTPLDLNIYQLAKQQGKQVGGLETTAEQLGYFDQFTEAEQVTMIDETLQALEEKQQTGKDGAELMTQWYLNGAKTDIDQLMKEISPSNIDRKLEKKTMDVLLTQRNKTMAESLSKQLKQNPDKKLFVAVGAGHLSSKKNIPYFLKELGIESTRFTVK